MIAKKIVAVALVVTAIMMLEACTASGDADNHKGGVKVEGNK